MSTIATPVGAGDPGGVARGEGEAGRAPARGRSNAGRSRPISSLSPQVSSPTVDITPTVQIAARRCFFAASAIATTTVAMASAIVEVATESSLPEQEEVVVLLRERLRPRAQVLVELHQRRPLGHDQDREHREQHETQGTPTQAGGAQLGFSHIPVQCESGAPRGARSRESMPSPGRPGSHWSRPRRHPRGAGQFRACARAGVGSFRLADLAMVPIQDHGLSSRGTP